MKNIDTDDNRVRNNFLYEGGFYIMNRLTEYCLGNGICVEAYEHDDSIIEVPGFGWVAYASYNESGDYYYSGILYLTHEEALNVQQ